jgi:hypothetical protein
VPIDELESSSDETGVLKCPFRRHEKTHVGSQGRFHEEKERTGARSGGTREHMSLTQGRYRRPVGRGWTMGVKTRLTLSSKSGGGDIVCESRKNTSP